jgi:hypothetical protein
MATRREVFPSRYLAAEDFQPEGTVLTVDHCEFEKMQDGEKKLVMYFKEMQKGVIVNATKWKAMEMLTGSDESDDWDNARVRVFPGETTYNSDIVPCLYFDKKKPKPTMAVKGERAAKPSVAETAEALKSAKPAREPGDDDDGTPFDGAY